MNEHEGQAAATNDEPKPLAEQSPTEKLETETPISPAAPGIESSANKEVKNEDNPNTE